MRTQQFRLDDISLICLHYAMGKANKSALQELQQLKALLATPESGDSRRTSESSFSPEWAAAKVEID